MVPLLGYRGNRPGCYGWGSIRFACTVVPNEALTGYVDIWIPLTKNFDAVQVEKAKILPNLTIAIPVML